MGTGSVSRGKAAGVSSDYFPPACAEVKNVWSYTSTPPICLRGVDTENFTFYCYCFVNFFFLLLVGLNTFVC